MPFIGESGLKHRTVKSYLSAIHFLHISEGLSDPFRAPLSRLHYVLRGVKRIESEKNTPCRERLTSTAAKDQVSMAWG